MISPWWAVVPFTLAVVCAGLFRRARQSDIEQHQKWLDQLSTDELCAIDFETLYSVPLMTRVKHGVGVAVAVFAILFVISLMSPDRPTVPAAPAVPTQEPGDRIFGTELDR